MSLFSFTDGVRLGVALKNLQGKEVTVNFGLYAHMMGWLDTQEEYKALRELDEPWIRTISSDRDIQHFCRYCDGPVQHAIYTNCGGRTFNLEGFTIEHAGDKTTVTLKWGS